MYDEGMDLKHIAARVAGQEDAEGDALKRDPVAFIHMRVDMDAHPDLDPDGTLASAFSDAVHSLGGDIPDWEDDWFEIEVPMSELKRMVAAIEAIKAGSQGPDAQKIAQAYSIDEVYADDGDGNPGDVVPRDQYE